MPKLLNKFHLWIIRLVIGKRPVVANVSISSTFIADDVSMINSSCWGEAYSKETGASITHINDLLRGFDTSFSDRYAADLVQSRINENRR